MRPSLPCALGALLTLGACATSDQLSFALRATAEGERVLASMDDPETARLASASRLQRLEELLRVAPSDPRARMLLVRAWARHALLFLEDDLEDARDRGNNPDVQYHALRTRNAYERAILHGREYLGAAAFDDALQADSLPAFLAARPSVDPSLLLWMGAAWLGRLRVASGDYRQLASRSRAGELLIERALNLDPSAAPWGHLLLGLWQGRTGGDLERARAHFDQSSRSAEQKLLATTLQQARVLLCQSQDPERWEALLRSVLEARDLSPEYRLENVLAKRKAARDLQGPRRAQCTP